MQFGIAREHHAVVDEAAWQNVDLARRLWDNLSSGRIYSETCEAVTETMPAEYAALLRNDDIACAYAHAFLFAVLSDSCCPKGFELREQLRSAWEAFGDRAKNADDFCEGFGWSRGSAWKNYREVASADVDTESVKRIAKLAGRMYTAMRGGASSPLLNTPAEVCNVIQGSDVSKMIAGELGLLGVPVLCDLQMMRIVGHKATIYQTKGTEKKSKGPLVLVADESGSMHGHRHEWAAAAMIALARVAKDEKRLVSVVHFSESVMVQDLDPGNPSEVTKLIKTHLGGGTDIARALRATVRKVTELRKKSGALADAVLITDGIDHGEDIPAAVDALVKECNLWTVCIDCEIPEENPLRAKAKEYVHLTGWNTLGVNDAVPLVKAAK